MLDKLRPRSIYDVMAAVGCIAALATGTAYAANTIHSSDIVDNEVGSADVKDNSINTFDVHSFLGVDVVDGSLTRSPTAGCWTWTWARPSPGTSWAPSESFPRARASTAT